MATATVDTTSPNGAAPTAERWRDQLNKALDARQAAIKTYEDYYAGKHRLQFATTKFRQIFGNLFAAFADNWCDLVVDAAVERLKVEGFRFGPDAGADTDAWNIWQENCLDAESMIAHTEAVKHGVAYALVEPPEQGGDVAKITVEHPSQVIVAYAAGSRRDRAAALKKWVDDDGYAMATLYLPDQVLKYRSRAKAGEGNTQWEPREGDTEVRNPLGVVPMVPLPNNPSMLGGGTSDIEKVIDLQNAINKLATDMIVASEYAAFRQRWATGIDMPGVDPDTGEPTGKGSSERFLSSVDRVWAVKAADAKFGDFNVTDLANYVKAIEMLIQHVAAQTRTPPHYLLGSAGSFPSGESLKATETGLVAKAKRKQLSFGEGWEEAIRLAFLAVDDTKRGESMDAETIWMDPEARTEGERVDALLKMGELGVPEEILWEKWGLTPQEIQRIKEIRAKQPAQPPPEPPGVRVTETVPLPPGSPGPPTASPPVPAGAPEG